MGTIRSIDYVKALVKRLEERLKKQGMKLPSRSTAPMSSNYRRELDESSELDANDITIFQELIGDLTWPTEKGKVDILHELLVFSVFLASPCEVFLHQVFHIFAFMKKNPKLKIYFDPRFPNIDPTSFSGSSTGEFREQYRDVMEELPKYILEPRGTSVTINILVHASHASDKKTI